MHKYLMNDFKKMNKKTRRKMKSEEKWKLEGNEDQLSNRK